MIRIQFASNQIVGLSMIHPKETDKLLVEVVEAAINKNNISSIRVNSMQSLQMSCTLDVLTMYSDGAMNSMVLDLTSGRRVTSPYDLLTGSYWNSSGTTK